ncbi:MAG TPA: Gfo/Idh/MocA family oxidoreductase [Urbifossiella sp.]|jgi:predicted dehydrogenase|nr:Gfo/Idh/MocA family oxidoreductase [Urbifossiella sp.]
MSDPLTRRTFLGASVAAVASAPALTAAANDKVVVGVMGAGGRGTYLSRAFAALPNVEVAYICDVDPGRAAAAAKGVAEGMRSSPRVVGDFRRILDDRAVDLFVCAAPNHWHAVSGILACQAGKHVYVEKPCSHNPAEGEALVAAARRADRRVQMGNQRRSFPKVIEGIQALREGIIGRVYFAQSWYTNNRPTIGTGMAKDPPAGLDYALWQGPAPAKPFKSNYLHYNWHWFWQWGNGELGNNGVHTIDLCRWGLGVDYPTAVTSSGGRYRFKDDQETPDTNIVNYEFADGKTITWEGFSCNQIPTGSRPTALFQGEKGSLALFDGGYTVYDDKGKEVQKETGGGTAEPLHFANILSAIRTGTALSSEIAEGHKTTLLCHLGNIAYRTGKRVVCDPANGRPRDPDAMRLWTREYAAGWEPRA